MKQGCRGRGPLSLSTPLLQGLLTPLLQGPTLALISGRTADNPRLLKEVSPSYKSDHKLYLNLVGNQC